MMQYGNTCGLGPGNISYHDILYMGIEVRAKESRKSKRWSIHGRRTIRLLLRCTPRRDCFENLHLGDQFGDSLLPVVVNWRGWKPSASMTQIWRVPPRVDSKTRWRPSGAQLGRSLRPWSRVISRSCWEVGSTMKRS